MNQKHRSPGPIPSRWLYCPRKSESIIVERFIALKTPLSKDFNDQMPKECWFQPEMIFAWCNTVKMKLGLWIDLTNTKRFYDRKLVEGHKAQYVKLECRGHGETPSLEQTRAFMEIVEEFIQERPFDMIAVHCTHGFNRTGFLLVSYMVERLDFSLEAALLCFAKARPPGIYKQDYINELYNRYEKDEDPIMAPEMPSWCFEQDDSMSQHGSKRSYDEAHCSSQQSRYSEDSNGLDGEDQVDDDEDRNDNAIDANAGNAKQRPRKRRKPELVVKNPTFMQGVSGVKLVVDQPRVEMLQRKVQDMCGWETGGFPGAQPVSMDCHNMNYLREIPYRVSWKADGTRYMMLINRKDEVYFIDRNNSCFEVENVTFVRANKLDEHLEDTLVDGEMVIDHYNGESIPRYLIYDIVKIHNADIGKQYFPDRLRCIRKEIIEPRHKAIMSGVINRAAEPFSVRLKDFYEINQTASLLGEKFAKMLLHEPDGLIFQPAKEPYTAGVCKHVLKWKPSELNSVDFRLKIVVQDGEGMVKKKIGKLYVLGSNEAVGEILLTKQLRELDGKIIECTWNLRNKRWEFLRERTDKTLPNSLKTAKSVFESICNPVTKDMLLDLIALHGFREDNDRMPPPSSNHVFRNSHPQQHQRTEQQHY